MRRYRDGIIFSLACFLSTILFFRHDLAFIYMKYKKNAYYGSIIKVNTSCFSIPKNWFIFDSSKKEEDGAELFHLYTRINRENEMVTLVLHDQKDSRKNFESFKIIKSQNNRKLYKLPLFDVSEKQSYILQPEHNEMYLMGMDPKLLFKLKIDKVSCNDLA